MTIRTAIAFLEMEYAIMVNPIKKAKISEHMNILTNYRNHVSQTPPILYIESELRKDKAGFEKEWLELCLNLFLSLE